MNQLLGQMLFDFDFNSIKKEAMSRLLMNSPIVFGMFGWVGLTRFVNAILNTR